MAIRTQLKRAVERLAGHQVWIERSSDPEAVAALIRRLRPVAIDTPFVRIGGPVDGGYLLPDDFGGIDACISPGVSTWVGFDSEIAARGIEVFMADASVDGPPEQNPRFHFTKKFIDVYEDSRQMRLDSLAAMVPAALTGDRMLQMDIESAEYRVLLDASDALLQSLRIMVIEFHDLDRMFGRFPFAIIEATFNKLLRHHHVVHIHPNNSCTTAVRGEIAIPPVLEFTFYRKDRARLAAGGKVTIPHPLDTDNLTDYPHVALPEMWYRG
jgi:hypothetical protein